MEISIADKALVSLQPDDFLSLLNASELPTHCQTYFNTNQLSYYPCDQKQRAAILADIQQILHQNQLKKMGAHQQELWEQCWQQTKQNFHNKPDDPDSLTPNYFWHQPLRRLNNNFVMPAHQDFEKNFVACLATYLYSTYLPDINTIYEFGCGSGHNLRIASQLFPTKKLIGLDWSKAACELVANIGNQPNLNISSALFNMFEPKYDIKLAPNSAVITHGAFEQLGNNFTPMLNYLLNNQPEICVQVEPLYELYDLDNPFDTIAADYIKQRNYLYGYVNTLKKLEQQQAIEILNLQRVRLGAFYHDGFSVVVWRPKR